MSELPVCNGLVGMERVFPLLRFLIRERKKAAGFAMSEQRFYFDFYILLCYHKGYSKRHRERGILWTARRLLQ
jgi:hypothetical protein